MKIIIRACEERAEFVNYLKEILSNAEWCFDTSNNAMDTFLRAMNQAGDSPCIHMEEDIVLTTDFENKVLKAIKERPKEVIQFFSMRKSDIEIGSRYDYGRKFMMNQCFYLPENYSKMILDHYRVWKDKEKHPTGYDLLIADFLKRRKEKYWIHVPSLVQHRTCMSLINKKRPNNRTSKTFMP